MDADKRADVVEWLSDNYEDYVERTLHLDEMDANDAMIHMLCLTYGISIEDFNEALECYLEGESCAAI